MSGLQTFYPGGEDQEEHIADAPVPTQRGEVKGNGRGRAGATTKPKARADQKQASLGFGNITPPQPTARGSRARKRSNKSPEEIREQRRANLDKARAAKAAKRERIGAIENLDQDTWDARRRMQKPSALGGRVRMEKQTRSGVNFGQAQGVSFSRLKKILKPSFYWDYDRQIYAFDETARNPHLSAADVAQLQRLDPGLRISISIIAAQVKRDATPPSGQLAQFFQRITNKQVHNATLDQAKANLSREDKEAARQYLANVIEHVQHAARLRKLDYTLQDPLTRTDQSNLMTMAGSVRILPGLNSDEVMDTLVKQSSANGRGVTATAHLFVATLLEILRKRVMFGDRVAMGLNNLVLACQQRLSAQDRQAMTKAIDQVRADLLKFAQSGVHIQREEDIREADRQDAAQQLGDPNLAPRAYRNSYGSGKKGQRNKSGLMASGVPHGANLSQYSALSR